MRMIGRAALFLLVPVALAGCSGKAFQEFTSKEGGFKVLMPGTPKEQDGKSPAGTLKMYISQENNNGYAAGYIDLPIPAKEPEAVVQTRLDGAVQGAAGNIHGKVLSQSRIMLENKYPGREVVLDTGGKLFAKVRFFLVNQRMYQLMSIGTSRSWIDSSDTAKFLDSFQLLTR